jgi:hypothetical protein
MICSRLTPNWTEVRPQILPIAQINPNYRYVDGTPTPTKIQMSHLLKVGQFYIDVYSIFSFK